jgi:CDP-diacylglycerol--glycerol-3-phosphate 3-phosphatidyltransferase
LAKKEIFYISNLLSLSRFVLLIIAVFFLISNWNFHYLFAIIVIVLIWFSDILDGYFARKRNEVSDLGKIIDPLADKITIVAIALVLLIQNILPLWFVLVLIVRDVFIFSGGVFLKQRKGVIVQSNWTGKITVFIIGLTLLLSILFESIRTEFGNKIFIYHIENLELLWNIMILLSIVMAIMSLTVYFIKFIGVLTEKR